MPLVPYYLFLAAKHRSWSFFTLANTGIPHGGVFGESKADISSKIDSRYQPRSAYFQTQTNLNEVLNEMVTNGISFPIVAKPNVGERGSMVEKIADQQALKNYLSKNENDLIIQEFIEYPIELGVLYYRTPLTGNSGITSIVQKEFLSVVGDGKSTLKQLIDQHDRARMYVDVLETNWLGQFDSFPQKGEKVNLQPIGNHCLGTKFLDANYLITDALVKVFDDIAKDIEGFSYGRFDLKVKDIESFQKGEYILIMELNGVTSEPGHIYDPKHSLFKAYKDTIKSLKRLSEVCRENKLLGYKETKPKELAQLILGHFANKEESKKEELIYS